MRAALVLIAACATPAVRAPIAPSNAAPAGGARTCAAPPAFTVDGLRADRAAHLGRDVTVRGTVRVVHSCVDQDPARCVPAHLELAGDPVLTVVQIPDLGDVRPGDDVVITGRFARSTPLGAFDDAGLVVFASIVDLRTCLITSY